MADKELLREYVREVLKEDDTGGAGYGGFGGGEGSMNNWAFGMVNYGPSLKSIFIDPFLDVGKVFKAQAMKMTTRFKTLYKVIVETALTTLIPFLQSNYTLIFKQEKEELAKIKQKYAQAFSAVDKAFTEDVKILTFMLDPTTFVTATVAAKAPEQVLNTLEIFTHGSESMAKYFEDVRKRLDAIKKDLEMDPDDYKLDKKGAVVPKGARGPYLTQKKRELFKKAGITDALEFDDEVMFEAPMQQAVQQPQSPEQQQEALMQQVLSNPEVKKAIATSPLARQMQADARRVESQISSRILGEAQKVMSAKSLADLERLSKKQLGSQQLQQLPPQERQKAEQAMVSQVKQAMKKFYVTTLQNEINGTLQNGVDPNNLYILALKGTLSKISSLN